MLSVPLDKYCAAVTAQTELKQLHTATPVGQKFDGLVVRVVDEGAVVVEEEDVVVITVVVIYVEVVTKVVVCPHPLAF